MITGSTLKSVSTPQQLQDQLTSVMSPQWTKHSKKPKSEDRFTRIIKKVFGEQY